MRHALGGRLGFVGQMCPFGSKSAPSGGYGATVLQVSDSTARHLASCGPTPLGSPH